MFSSRKWLGTGSKNYKIKRVRIIRNKIKINGKNKWIKLNYLEVYNSQKY